EVDRSLLVCLQAGFRKVLVRGDTDFSQTEHLDGWDAFPRVRFIFGFDAGPKLRDLADELPQNAWRRLQRPARYRVQTQPRHRADNVKGRICPRTPLVSLSVESRDTH